MQVTAENVLTVKRIFELANRAHFLYVPRNQAERGQLLKSVLLNCETGRRKSLARLQKAVRRDLRKGKKNKNGRGERDLNLRPPGPEPDFVSY